MEELLELWALAWVITIVGGAALLGIVALGTWDRRR